MKYVDDKKRQKCDKKQWCNFGDDESCVEMVKYDYLTVTWF